MEVFAHIKTVIAIIMGLGLTHLIKGTVSFIQHPGRSKYYWVHLLWVFYVFLLLVHFWWWEFTLKNITEWYFLDYFFLVCYVILYFILCALLYPDDLDGYKGYKEYFYSRKKWFFAILALTFLADIMDTYIKGPDYSLLLNGEYYIRIISHILLCAIAFFINNRLFHKVLAVLFIIYEVIFIIRLFNVEG